MDATHDVVGRRADLHRLAGNIDVRQLFELVIHARQLALDVFGRVRELLLDPGNIEIDAAVRAAAPFLDLAHDAARHVIAGEQFRRTARIFVTGAVTPAFFRAVRRLRFVIVRDVVEHETFAHPC